MTFAPSERRGGRPHPSLTSIARPAEDWLGMELGLTTAPRQRWTGVPACTLAFCAPLWLNNVSVFLKDHIPPRRRVGRSWLKEQSRYGVF